jgi:hypothetical protein
MLWHLHPDLAGLWPLEGSLEIGFGGLGDLHRTTFADLHGAERWVAQRFWRRGPVP